MRGITSDESVQSKYRTDDQTYLDEEFTPKCRHVQKIRLEIAQELMDSGMTLEEVKRATGFRDEDLDIL